MDHQNLTGYAQVVEEWLNGELARSYALGLDVILQWAAEVADGARVLLIYDGHQSTRGLVDATGRPLSGQIYRYDAYGNAIGFDAGSALTSRLYTGEHFDRDVGRMYAGQRWYDLATGRWNRVDPVLGNFREPLSLHKYLYVHADPINAIDPTGLYAGGLTGLMVGMSMASNIRSLKNEVDFMAFDVAVAVFDAIEMKQTVDEAVWSFMVDQAVGFGIGWLAGKGLGILSAIWENGIGHGANRHALREFFGGSAARLAARRLRHFDTREAWQQVSDAGRRLYHNKPALPAPNALNPVPGDLANDPLNVHAANAEFLLAKWTHAAPDEVVISWGGIVNQGGPDVISVNMDTGEVIFADAKYSDFITPGGSAPTIDQFDGNRLRAWIRDAELEVPKSALPAHVKQKALANLQNGNVGVAVVGFGTKSGQQRLYEFSGFREMHSEIRQTFDI